MGATVASKREEGKSRGDWLKYIPSRAGWRDGYSKQSSFLGSFPIQLVVFISQLFQTLGFVLLHKSDALKFGRNGSRQTIFNLSVTTMGGIEWNRCPTPKGDVVNLP